MGIENADGLAALRIHVDVDHAPVTEQDGDLVDELVGAPTAQLGPQRFALKSAGTQGTARVGEATLVVTPALRKVAVTVVGSSGEALTAEAKSTSALYSP